MAKNKYFSLINIFRLTLITLAFSCAMPVFADEGVSEFIPADQAFVLSAKETGNKAEITLKITPGYLLYQEHVKIKTLANKDFSEKMPALPKGILNKDETLGDYVVYKNELHLTSPLSKRGADKGIRIEYQGCAEAGFCYPPQTKQILFLDNGQVNITDIKPGLLVDENTALQDSSRLPGANVMDTGNEKTAATATNAQATSPSVSESDEIAGYFNQKSLPLTLLAFLSIGVLLAFTPCVLPMVPILANILVGQNDTPPTRARTIYLASLYVLSVAFCYAGAGLAAGLLGSHLQAYLQQPQFLMSLGFLLLLFALNQFNFIHFQFPRVFSAVFNKVGIKHKQGSALGAVVMGGVSALMASPCVTPALVGALTYIGQTGNALLGGAALFSLALGMGLPLLIAASIGSHLLPKAGRWMTYVKGVTGVLLLVLSVSIFIRATPTATSGEMIASASPLSSQFTTIQSPSELSSALTQARNLNQHVILDVYADWCVSCRQMDKEVFENKVVLDSLKDVALLRLDLTHSTPGHEELQKELDIIGPPMVLFFDRDGKEARSFRMAGKTKSNNFIEHVSRFVNQTQNKQQVLDPRKR